MLSVGLWRWYINITNTILDIIHSAVFYLKRNISATGFCLRLQVLSLKEEDRIQSPKRCVLSKRQEDGCCPEL
jgi:hypothetical protein